MQRGQREAVTTLYERMPVPRRRLDGYRALTRGECDSDADRRGHRHDLREVTDHNDTPSDSLDSVANMVHTLLQRVWWRWWWWGGAACKPDTQPDVGIFIWVSWVSGGGAGPRLEKA